MRQLEANEVVLQLWSSEDPDGSSLNELVTRIAEDVVKSQIGNVSEIAGPTFHIPDYFSDLYGTVMGWLIYITDADPKKLKEFALEYEKRGGLRFCDIDVYTDYFNKISRKDLGKP